MDLYLIRHAEAAPLGENGATEDADRALTEQGKSQARLIAAGLQQHGVHLDLLLTSPLLRAQQTAEEILQHWGQPAPPLESCTSLLPGSKRRRLARSLKGLSAGSVGVVGHQPDLGSLAGWLIGDRKVAIDLAKAGVAYIQCSGAVGKGSGKLVWLVTPEWLGRETAKILAAST